VKNWQFKKQWCPPKMLEREAKWDARFLAMAKFVSGWSKDPSTKVGAVIVNAGNRIVSMGYNGFAQSMPDREELYANREEKYSRIVHGEINAIIFAERPVRGMTLYTYPFMPCDRCAVQVIQNGIVRVVAPKLAADKEERWKASMDKTRQYFTEAGVELVELDYQE
jgi:dCMP deaminase